MNGNQHQVLVTQSGIEILSPLLSSAPSALPSILVTPAQRAGATRRAHTAERNKRLRLHGECVSAAKVLVRRAEALERAGAKNGREGKLPGMRSKHARALVLRRVAAVLADLHKAPLAEVERLLDVPVPPFTPPR